MSEILNRDYMKFIRETVYADPQSILLFRQKLLTDDIWEIAIDQEASLFKYVKYPSIELCYYALDADGSNLRYIPSSRINAKMVAIATRSNKKGSAPYIPKRFWDNGKYDSDFYSKFDEGLTSKEQVYLEKIRKKPNIIKEIDNPSEDLICEAIKLDPNIYLYYTNHTPKMKLIIEEYYPQLTSLFPGFGDN